MNKAVTKYTTPLTCWQLRWIVLRVVQHLEAGKRKERRLLRLLLCDNKILVGPKLVEQVVIDEVRKHISLPEQMHYLL